jgi:hypothetical protein
MKSWRATMKSRLLLSKMAGRVHPAVLMMAISSPFEVPYRRPRIRCRFDGSIRPMVSAIVPR